MVTLLGQDSELSIPASYMKELRLLYCTVNPTTARDTMVGMANATRNAAGAGDNFADILSVAADPEMDFCKSSSLGAESTEYVLGKGWGTVLKNLFVAPLTSTTGTGQLCDRITARMNTLLFDYDFAQHVRYRMEKEHKAFLEEENKKDPKDRVWNAEKELEFQKRLEACITTLTPHRISADDDRNIVWGLNKYPVLDGETIYEDVRSFCLETYVMGRGGKPDEAPKRADDADLPYYLRQQTNPVGPFETMFVAGLLNIPWSAWVEYQDFCTPVSKTEMIMSPIRYGAYIMVGWIGWLGRRALAAIVMGGARLLFGVVGIPLGAVKKFLLELVDRFINRPPPPSAPGTGGSPEGPKSPIDRDSKGHAMEPLRPGPESRPAYKTSWEDALRLDRERHSQTYIFPTIPETKTVISLIPAAIALIAASIYLKLVPQAATGSVVGHQNGLDRTKEGDLL